jgi:outer membrane protein assembly factor BamD
MQNNKIRNNYITLICLGLMLTACSSTEEKVVETDPKTLFQEGNASLSKDKYNDAISKFETLEREHPASEFASEAQIRRAYAQYSEGNYITAVMTIEEFVKQYPSHTSTPYMYYLKGLSYYDQIVDTGRDQELTMKAIEALNELITRFPESKYAKDAQFKIDYAYNNIAGKEMEIGRFYLNKKQMIASLNRFKNVVDKYQTTIFVPEALYRLTEIYYALGDMEQSKKYAAVLGHNYPNDEWYKKAYSLISDQSYEEQTPWYKKSIKSIW